MAAFSSLLKLIDMNLLKAGDFTGENNLQQLKDWVSTLNEHQKEQLLLVNIL